MMKKLLQKENIKKYAYIAGSIVIILLIFDYLIMPWYVSGKEVIVPKVIGLNEDQAKEKLSDGDLDFVKAGERYDENYPKGTVIFQKPIAGSKVKEGRRIFLFISSGLPMVKVPPVTGKLLRDAQLALQRMDLTVGDTVVVESDQPKNTVLEQQFYSGREINKGSKVNLKISSGRVAGLIAVPDLLGKSLSQAEKTITDNKLSVGKINYQPSFSLLPNTIIDQYPSKDSFVKEGTAVDIFVTKDVETPQEVEEKK